MCEGPKIYAFAGDLPPSPGDGGVLRERWRQLKLTWRDGRVVPAADNDGSMREDESSYEVASASAGLQNTKPPQHTAGNEQASHLHRYLPLPARQPEPQLSLVSQYLSTSFLRGASQAQPKYVQRRADHSSGAPERFSLTTCSLRGSDKPSSALRYSPQDELLSAARRSPEGSGETVGLAQWAERGGVVLETTSYGVLCSQQAGRPASSPASK